MGLSRDAKVELLRGVELFTGVDPEGLEQIAERAIEVDFPSGRWIVRQGEIGTGFFLVVRGRARAVRNDQILGEFGPGDFFGELSVLDGRPRTAHVIADEPTTCLALTSWEFEALLESQPRVTLAILRGVAARLRDVSEHHRH